MTIHSNLFNIQGNMPLQEADVICVADVPSDPGIQAKNIMLIDRIWKDHLVLIEHVPAGKELVVADEPSLDFEIVKKVTGWDLPDADKHVQETVTQEKVIGRFVSTMNEYVLLGKWREVVAASNEWKQFLALIPDRLNGAKEELVGLLAEPQSTFKERIFTIHASVKADWQSVLSKRFKETFQARLSSLEQTIDATLESNNKLIVCLPINFIVNNPQLVGKPFEIAGFRAFLQNKKHAVIVAKNSPLTIEDQPSLWDAVQAGKESVSSASDQGHALSSAPAIVTPAAQLEAPLPAEGASEGTRKPRRIQRGKSFHQKSSPVDLAEASTGDSASEALDGTEDSLIECSAPLEMNSSAYLRNRKNNGKSRAGAGYAINNVHH